MLLSKGVQTIQRQLMGNEVKTISLVSKNKAEIPNNLTQLYPSKFSQIDGIKIQSFQEIAAVIDKDKMLNQLEVNYNKNNKKFIKSNSFDVEKNTHQRPRELEVEL